MSEIILLRGSRHVITECGVCGIVYTVPEIINTERYQEGGFNFCPNGHQWGWSKEKCEREKLRKERDRLKQNEARLEQELAEQAAETQRVITAKARLEKRIHGGTCPCCKRHFTNVERHMKSKHANVVAIKAAG